jgi:hypothetical protein
MLQQPENYFHSLPEPERGCLLFLRDFLLAYPVKLEESWKNHTPFYYCNKKWIGWINYDPKTRGIYISFANGNKMDHPKLVSEGRKKMKILHVDPNRDVDINSLGEILKQVTVLTMPR